MSPQYQQQPRGPRGGGPQGGGGRPNHYESRPEATVPVFNFARAALTADLFSDKAESYAKSIGATGRNKSTQLRNFYNELVMWEERCGGDVEKLRANLPYIYMMKAKAAYAKGRENIDQEFQAFFTGIINGIKEQDIDTLKNAKLFFEAFMGFYKQYCPKSLTTTKGTRHGNHR